MPATEFLAAGSLDEALAALAQPDAVALAGGTAIGLLVRNRLLAPSRLVWLGRVPELSEIRQAAGGSLDIGAATTLDLLARSPAVRARHPVLADAASRVGNVRVRSAATVGGHVVNADPRQDLPPVLLALAAEMVVRRRDGERRVVAEQFFRGHHETALEPGEVLMRVLVPPPVPDQRSVYIRFTPGSEDDYPTVGVAATIRDGVVYAGLGGVAGRPLLVTGPPDPEAIADWATEAADPVDDQRGSAIYKKLMIRLIARRAINELL